MDPNESSGLNSYYQQQPPQQSVPLPSSSLNSGVSPIRAAAAAAAAAAASIGGLESVKRKRGRPRKYNTPEEAAAAKRLSSASTSSPMSSSKKNYRIFGSGSAAGASSASKKFQPSSIGISGHSFTLHVISVGAGEDVSQKIMMFLQQSKREILIISASGSIATVVIRQSASSGGTVSYEGPYEILSLSGSFVSNELGRKTGGLSVCLSSSANGEIVGGSVGGPLKAAGPIQVIVGTFLLDGKRDVVGDTKGDGGTGKFPSPIAGPSSYSASGTSFRSPIDSSFPNIGGQYMFQTTTRSTHHFVDTPQSLDWMRDHSGNNVQRSPENGNYDHIQDLRS